MLRPISEFITNKITIIDRLIIRLGDGQQSSLCILQEQLPQIYRVTAIEYNLLPDNSYEINASIFHQKAQLDVQWITSQIDSRLAVDQLVSIRWKGKLAENSGKIIISRLAAFETPNASINLIDTIPVTWCANSETLQRARKLFELLSAVNKKVFNNIFWDSNNLYALISSPSFIDTIERCERVMKCEYKFFIDIEQTMLMLLVNTSSKKSVSKVIIEKIIEAITTEKNGLESECWSNLLMSLDY